MSRKTVLMFLGGFLAIFLGAFLAFYLVFSNVSKHSDAAYAFNSEIDDFSAPMSKFFESHHKLIEKMDKEFDDLFEETRIPVGMVRRGMFNNDNAVNIRTEDLKSAYKVTINLKPFNNDRKNIEVKVKDDIVSITGKYKSKEKDAFKSQMFYQKFNLPVKVDPSAIKEEKAGSNLVITIPKSGV